MQKTTTGGAPLALEIPYSLCPQVFPDKNGDPLRTVFLVKRTPEETIKIHWWHKADPLDLPHSHPWDFKSEILIGGYTEEVYKVNDKGVVTSELRTYNQGDVNTNIKDTYHRVVSIIPGTVTRMITGPATDGNPWGWLDTETGEYKPAGKDPNFMNMLKALNPWMT
jgi:hypothetical protein